jgi:uncharacterized protein
MRCVLEINHPAQVHLLRNLYLLLTNKNHFVKVFIKNDPAISSLMNLYKIPYCFIGKKGKGILGKLFAQVWFDLRMLFYILPRNISIGIGSSITNDHIAALTRMKSIHLSDDDEDVVPLMSKYAYPFSTIILSPQCCIFKNHKEKNITYSGYHELAYLHPKRFNPDSSVLHELSIRQGEPFFVLRFNSFTAHHDIGIRGLSLEQKLGLINVLSEKGKVFITTEKKIEPELSQYQLKISPVKIHSLLYYATMFIGDSQTMTSEAAVLGTPAIRCNSFVGRISYLEEEEHVYGLTYGFKPEDFSSLLTKVQELLSIPDLREEWQRRRQRMLAEKIDVTAFIFWFIENYPESVKIMRENKDYQYNFK